MTPVTPKPSGSSSPRLYQGALLCLNGRFRACARLVALGLLASPTPALAQESRADKDSPKAEEKKGGEEESESNLVTTNARRLERPLYDSPFSLSVVDHELVAQGTQRVRLDESLKFVPGVHLQNRDNFAQGQRISIRGAGARAPFGVRGITILVDGIPYTLPDGQSQLDAVDLDRVVKIEVIRGPSSVLYGNGAGGVLSITTEDGRGPLALGRSRDELGSDGYLKWATTYGNAHGDWSYHLGASALDFDGWRPQSRTEKRLASGKVSGNLGAGWSLQIDLNVLNNPVSQDPGALKREEVKQKRRSAAPGSLATRAGQQVSQQTVGVQIQRTRRTQGTLKARTFYTHRSFEQQLPFFGSSLIGFDRHHAGGGLSWSWNARLGDVLGLSLVTGIDVAGQRDDRERFEVTQEQGKGERAEDEVQQALSVGGFAQGDLELGHGVVASLGGRYDQVRLSITDGLPGGDDTSGERKFDVLNGSGGLSWRYLNAHQLWASTGTAYETPTFSEFANPTGDAGFRVDLSPQRGWNREVGTRGSFRWGGSYDVTLFSVLGSDEITPYEQDGRTFYANLGQTTRQGLEASLGWRHPWGFRADSALTLAQYRFEGDPAIGGNRLPGLPQTMWVSRAGWAPSFERFVLAELEHIGSIVADNLGAVEVPGYWLLHARAGWGWEVIEAAQLAVYGSVRNIVGEAYNANVRVNANFGRVFEPAPGRTWFLGLELTL